MFIDTHCHLNYPPLVNNLNEIISRAKDKGVNKIICVGTDIESSVKAIEIADTYSGIFATVGIHPHDCKSAPDKWENELIRLSENPKVVAIGEIGLDYYRDYSPRELQISFFSQQINIARQLRKPVIIHNRRSDDDIRKVLVNNNYYNGVLHCFSSDENFANDMISLGLHISFTGNATYKSKKTERAVKSIPLDRLMLETDAPFITPLSLKGKTNEPAFLPVIAEKISDIRNCSPERIAKITTENAERFFRFPK